MDVPDKNNIILNGDGLHNCSKWLWDIRERVYKRQHGSVKSV